MTDTRSNFVGGIAPTINASADECAGFDESGGISLTRKEWGIFLSDARDSIAELARATLTAQPPASTNRLTDEKIMAIACQVWPKLQGDITQHIQFARAIIAATEAK